MSKPNSPLSLRLSENLRAQIERYAKVSGCSVSDAARTLIERGLSADSPLVTALAGDAMTVSQARNDLLAASDSVLSKLLLAVAEVGVMTEVTLGLTAKQQGLNVPPPDLIREKARKRVLENASVT